MRNFHARRARTNLSSRYASLLFPAPPPPTPKVMKGPGAPSYSVSTPLPFNQRSYQNSSHGYVLSVQTSKPPCFLELSLRRSAATEALL